MALGIDDATLKQILLQEHYIAAEDIARTEEFSKAHGVAFVDSLIQDNVISKDLLGQAIAEAYKIPYSNLQSTPPTTEQVNEIPERTAKQYRAVIFSETADSVIIATDKPSDPLLGSEIQKIFPQKNITITYALSKDLDASFIHYQKPLETRFGKIIEKQERIAPEILEEIFEDALVYHASDIHFEPQHKDIVVRFRVDGVLHEAGRIPKEYYENILNRIKVQSGLRIDEHFTTQDGSLRHEKDGTVVDMRTSIAPTIEGEKAVLRVLAAYVEGLSFNDIGLSASHQQLLKIASEKPFGMIIVAGPTGSGKTTTLYSLIKVANKPNVNITTIEDPVEYKVQGINQIQVNQQTDLTFAKGLRSIVRQDPDIILVGEIRDNETAEIAVNAALTGHLLYSTFHANDAATAIPRLLDMGVEPFLLTSTLQVIVAQRLVRKICNQCRYSITKKPSNFAAPQYTSVVSYFPGESITFYEGKGCEACGGTGYKGRTGIFEFIQITPDMQNLILHSPSTQEIWQLARKEGSQSLFEDGVEKVKTGVTTLEELLRIAQPPAHI